VKLLSINIIAFVLIFLYSLNCYSGTQKFSHLISLDAQEAKRDLIYYDFEPIKNWHAKPYLNVLKKFLSCYRADVIKNNIRKIYIVNRVYVNGKEIGAAYAAWNKTIVTSASPDMLYYLHHEFSSLLIYANSGLRTAWYKYNGAPYIHSTQFKMMSADHKLRKLGFYYDYSQVSFEEDFNVLAGMFLSQPSVVLREVKMYPRLKGKIKLIKRFYKNIFICSL